MWQLAVPESNIFDIRNIFSCPVCFLAELGCYASDLARCVRTQYIMSDDGENIAKRQFDLLYSSLCDIQKSLLDNTAKVAGFRLIAIGWIATSTAARDFLKDDELTRYVAVAALGGAFLFYALAARKAHQASLRTVELLNALDYLPEEHYLLRRVGLTTLVLFVVGNLFLVLLVASLILRTG